MGDIEGGILNREQRIKEGEWLYSPNKQYRMGMRDGEMVIEHVPTGNVIDRYGEQGSDANQIRFEDQGVMAAKPGSNSTTKMTMKSRRLPSPAIKSTKVARPLTTGMTKTTGSGNMY